MTRVDDVAPVAGANVVVPSSCVHQVAPAGRSARTPRPDERRRAAARDREHAARRVRARFLLRALGLLRRDDSRGEGRPRIRRARTEAGQVTFRAGQRVRIVPRSHEGHHRPPTYLKGKTGTIERLHESFTNPETRAYGGGGLPTQGLYLVG